MTTLTNHDKPISIVSSTNENFAPHLATLLCSLLDKNNAPFHFYIIDDGLSLRSKLLLNRTISSCNKAVISYISVDASLFENMVESNRIPQTAYYRIAIPNLITDPDVERIIYLDCDMLVMDSIEELWGMDLEEHLLGAVEDAGFHHRLETMGIPFQSSRYFNSGLMVLDLAKWRQEQISEKVLQFAHNFPKKLKFHDQDALNAILHDRWTPLHPKWNAQTYMMLKEKVHPTLLGHLQYREARKSPSIIHFCGHEKPWMGISRHPFASYYHHYRSKTAFDYEPITIQDYVEG
ncbi:universal stress protein UspA [Carnobacterium divergens]|uniref:glycosyltransferase family 8 protein n=1 Tax=Carnobacterium divergens TaxID=2748 RepID=UPI000E7325DF|nr:glycosyltransferase family 8 protein [Carnobacterium divergens]AOA00141.1 universal stress protein UspA [Carnobacterium divergens]